MLGDRVGFDGLVVAITGGSAGIGLAAAEALAVRGAAVALIGRSPERLADAVRAVRRSAPAAAVDGHVLDVTREDDMVQMAQRLLDRHGRIDILIAAAGLLRARPGVLSTVREMPLADWQTILDVNLKGTFLSNRAVLPAMLRRGAGQIINIASTSGRKAYAFDSAYCASKFGVIGLSEALAEEVRHHGIRVQVLLPGAVETPIWDQNGPIPKPASVLTPEQVVEALLELIALPPDTAMPELVVEPQGQAGAPAWLRRAGAG